MWAHCYPLAQDMCAAYWWVVVGACIFCLGTPWQIKLWISSESIQNLDFHILIIISFLVNGGPISKGFGFQCFCNAYLLGCHYTMQWIGVFPGTPERCPILFLKNKFLSKQNKIYNLPQESTLISDRKVRSGPSHGGREAAPGLWHMQH